jgi:signal recognition particle subunit SEC65
MPSKKEGKKVIWPFYFDIHTKRSKGMRVPKSLAVENTKTE